MSSVALLIIQSLLTFIRIYLLLLFLRVLLTWIPNINWMSQPFAALSQITDPYLNLFRSIIPPIGGIDLSPILAFLALQMVSWALLNVFGRAVLAMAMY